MCRMVFFVSIAASILPQPNLLNYLWCCFALLSGLAIPFRFWSDASLYSCTLARWPIRIELDVARPSVCVWRGCAVCRRRTAMLIPILMFCLVCIAACQRQTKRTEWIWWKRRTQCRCCLHGGLPAPVRCYVVRTPMAITELHCNEYLTRNSLVPLAFNSIWWAIRNVILCKLSSTHRFGAEERIKISNSNCETTRIVGVCLDCVVSRRCFVFRMAFYKVNDTPYFIYSRAMHFWYLSEWTESDCRMEWNEWMLQNNRSGCRWIQKTALCFVYRWCW